MFETKQISQSHIHTTISVQSIEQHFFPLDHEAKFEILRYTSIIQTKDLQNFRQAPQFIQDADYHFDSSKPIQHIFIIRGDRKHCFSGTQSQLNDLRLRLSQSLNQIGFHQYFHVLKKLGQGSSATVFSAERIEDNKEFAIRGLSKKYFDIDSLQEKAIFNEIAILRKLSHQSIVQLDSVYETENSIYMCMEFLAGGTLQTLLQESGQLTDQQICDIMISLLQGLEYLHSNGIMHRDIKPGNIVFRKSNHLQSAVIIDLGLATYVNSINDTYVKCGTKGYMAPEVQNSRWTRDYDESCDIFSLGIVLHQLLTGKKPTLTSSNTVPEFLINWNLKRYNLIHPSALDLLKAMLEFNPRSRISAKLALQHVFLCAHQNQSLSTQDISTLEMDVDDEIPVIENILKYNMTGMVMINKFLTRPSTLEDIPNIGNEEIKLDSKSANKLSKIDDNYNR